ncbi:MAG: DUF2059 domain-containing protein [Pontixanthobacter sp.]
MKRTAFNLPILLVCVPVPLSAQAADGANQAPTDIAITRDVHDDLYRFLRSASDEEAELDAIVRAMQGQFAAMPALASVEVDNPGFIEALTTSVRPMLKDHALRITKLAGPDIIALLRDGLTEKEARDALGFYESDIGQRVIAVTNQTLNYDRALGAAIQDKTITAENMERNLMDAGERGYSQLSATEQARANEAASTNSGMMKFLDLVPKIAALRARFENEPMLPAHEARMQAAMRSVFEQYGLAFAH